MAKKSIPKRRNGYYYINGKEYPSVTKILQDTLNKPALLYWYGTKASDIALKNPELNTKEVMAELNKFNKATRDRGHAIHELAQLVSEQPKGVAHYNISLPGFSDALYSWFDAFKPRTIKNEVEIYSDKWGYAGRCDYICRINEFKWLIEFKSGKYIYKEAGLQLAAYKKALQEQKIIEIDKTGVVLLTENREFIFKETYDDFQDFLRVYEVWKWLKKKGE